MFTILLRLNERDAELIRKYAAMHDISVSKLIRDSVIQMIEDENDVAAFDKAVAETRAIYTLEETKKELGLCWPVRLNLRILH